MTRLLTLAEYGDKTVFCERYSKAAHRILATASLAPALHFCSVIIGEVFMVVTDPVDGRDAYHQFEVCDELRQTRVGNFHDSGFVFEDVRRPSEVVFKSQEKYEGWHSRFIDFDWGLGMLAKQGYRQC